MNSRTDEIQKLIADIDNLLNSNGKRLSRLLSSQAQEEPKEVLEKIRHFLVSLQETETLANPNQPLSPELTHNSSLLTKFVEQEQNQSSAPPHQPQTENNHSLFQEFKNELSDLIQPLQGEITALLQERTILMQEIRQLEQKRLQNYSLSQQLANQEQIITEFLQVLMSRLVPTLTTQLAQEGANIANSANGTNSSRLELPPAVTQPFWESSEHGERLTQLTKELDQHLLSLDGTVNVVFEALQRNINTYQESLSQALARMHSTGLQGEQLMAGLVNNLTQSLQAQLVNSQQSVESEQNTPHPAAPSPVQSHNVTPILANADTTTPPDQANTDELDTVLLQLGIDALLSMDSPETPTTLLSDGWELANDEVDLIYASLFGNENFTYGSLDINSELITPDLPEVDVDENLASPAEVETVDTAAIMPDVWFNQSDSDLFDFAATLVPASLDFTDPPESETLVVSSSINLPSEPAPASLFADELETTPQELSSEPILASLAEIETQQSVTVSHIRVVPTQPNNTDIITSLVDIEFVEQVEDVSTPLTEPENLTVMNVAPIAEAMPEVATVKESNSSLDNYIAASPQENLLSSAVSQLLNPPDISLNEEQWLQLHQDLAKLDEPLSSHSQPVTKVDKQQPPPEPEITANPAVSQVASVSSPQTHPEQKIEVSTVPENLAVVTPIQPVNHHPESVSRSSDEVWYLGIDLGTTGISAALLNRSTGVIHPIYWSTETQPGTNSFQQSFRLPAEVYLPSASVPQVSPADVVELKNHLYSVQLKPYLQVAIPYKSEQQKWEPVLQFNESSAGPLIWVVRSLSKLLLTLKADRYSTTQGLIATAVGLNQRTFHGIVSNIAGVICNCPSSWSEQYRFNVREALLTSKLVSHPQQVFFIEEAIASLLSLLDGSNGEVVQLKTNQGLSSPKHSEHNLVGNTLIMNIGATATEMALVDIPETLSQLSHNSFMLHSFPYASKGLEQDIICQLLLSPKYRKSRWETPEESQKITSNPWQWQPAVPGLDRMQWQSLGWEELELPRLGEPDMPARIRLQQRLESSILGQAVLDAALALKLILQHQESFTLELADQRWVLQRRDLESQVFVPFARRLNRELNKLLVARGIPTEGINQAVLTGGVANLSVVNLWLRQKLPNAKIIQDSYLGENGAPNCSRVASGLALLPLHPQILEESRQQYTDYFLFTELLRLLPDKTFSFSEVLQLFEGRGINTSICQQRLLAFLEGELPPGLVPSAPESTWLTPYSRTNSAYQAIASAPLFEKQGNLTYRSNPKQLLILHRYLDAIKASTQQSLEEPYTVNFVSSLAHSPGV